MDILSRSGLTTKILCIPSRKSNTQLNDRIVSDLIHTCFVNPTLILLH